jgi:hypothetical protein
MVLNRVGLYLLTKDNFASKMCHILSGTDKQLIGFRTLQRLFEACSSDRRGYACQYTGYYQYLTRSYFRRFSLSKLKDNLEKEISIENLDGFKLKIVWCRGLSKGDRQALPEMWFVRENP